MTTGLLVRAGGLVSVFVSSCSESSLFNTLGSRSSFASSPSPWVFGSGGVFSRALCFFASVGAAADAGGCTGSALRREGNSDSNKGVGLRGGVGDDVGFAATAGVVAGTLAGLEALLERKNPENNGVVLRGGVGADAVFAATTGEVVDVVAGLEVLSAWKRPSNKGVVFRCGAAALDVWAETAGVAAGRAVGAGAEEVLELKRPSNNGVGLRAGAGDVLLLTTAGEATAAFGSFTAAAWGEGSDGLMAQDEDISINTTMGLGRRITRGLKKKRAPMGRKKCAGMIAKTL